MTLDQALYEMELVGHDFYLFVDKETRAARGGLPAARVRLRRDLARRALDTGNLIQHRMSDRIRGGP